MSYDGIAYAATAGSLTVIIAALGGEITKMERQVTAYFAATRTPPST